MPEEHSPRSGAESALQKTAEPVSRAAAEPVPPGPAEPVRPETEAPTASTPDIAAGTYEQSQPSLPAAATTSSTGTTVYNGTTEYTLLESVVFSHGGGRPGWKS